MSDSSLAMEYTLQDDSRGMSRSFERFFPQHTVDSDGYNVWTVNFSPRADTLDFGLYLYLSGTKGGKEAWAACEAYLQVNDQPRKLLYSGEDKNFDTYTFRFIRNRYYNYYNGHRLRFIVREKNSIADVIWRTIFAERTF